MDWTAMGAVPPTVTLPTRTGRVGLLSICIGIAFIPNENALPGGNGLNRSAQDMPQCIFKALCR
jgi:hypothetical protein